MNKITFHKMHGCGNDFMVVDSTESEFVLSADKITKLSDRHTGIGFDQLLVVERSPDEGIDFIYRIFNADGSEVEQCGNGARCFARFVYETGLTRKKHTVVKTKKGVSELYLNEDDSVTVSLGVPSFNESAVPVALKRGGLPVYLYTVDMGNPHAVIIVDDVDVADVKVIGQGLNAHSDFPDGINVGFMQIIDRSRVVLRVFERGAGETLACGSGACAAMVAARMQNLVDQQITVQLRGGEVVVEWEKTNSPVRLSGPAEFVYQGAVVI